MNSSLVCRWLCFATLALGGAALAISPAGLQQDLAAGAKITLVDVRSTTLYTQGHIPNAINIPASLVPQKQLPSLGRVVVYDDGLGVDTAQGAAAALNQKLGIYAEVLDGGFAAWEDMQSPTTRPPGLTREALPMITYNRLKQMPGEDLILVDLRQPQSGAAPKAALIATNPPLTDLQAEFPKASIIHSPFEPQSYKASLAASPAKSRLMVLIDKGDGAAQEAGRKLKANGIQRFVILVGGEEMLVRKGESGLKRINSVSTSGRPGGAVVNHPNP
jgi:rhodanese-related sulfurtransferase